MSRRNASVVEVLLELQLLDRVPRSGYLLRGVPDGESVAEHTFQLAFLVWALAADEPGVDRERAVAMALVHDLAEVRFGDLPRTAADYLPEGAKHEAEARAARDLLGPLPEAVELFAAYEERSSPEARFVKACDRLAIAVKSTVYVEQGHRAVGDLAERMARLDDDGFESVARVAAALRERQAG